MPSRFTSAAIFSLLLVTAVAGQTIRFDTNVGTFDMELNPTGNASLQPHVDNILAYVNAKRYDLTVINRAATGFVMQMGGFEADSFTLPTNFSDFNSVNTFDPLIVDADGDGQVDFDLTGLDNTEDTVSLALSTSANTGTASFFVNLGTNTSLDAANLRFVPFARIRNMATIDLIMSLDQNNYADGGLAGDNVPILSENRIVFVERAFVLEEPIVAPAALAATAAGGSSSGLSAAAATSLAPAIALNAVPEPSTFALAGLALLASAGMNRRKIC